MYVMTVLLVSAVILSVVSPLTSLSVLGDKGNNNDDKINNRSLINDISNQVSNSNLGAEKEQVQQLLQLMQTQIAQLAGQDKATKTINLINSIINLDPNGPVAQSLLYLAKQQAAGNMSAPIQAAINLAAQIYTRGYGDLTDALAPQNFVQSSEAPSSTEKLPTTNLEQQVINNGHSTQTNHAINGLDTTSIHPKFDQSRMEGIGEEPDTDENEANALSIGEGETTSGNHIVLPDDTPFKSNGCDGSLDKFVPNPFIQTINSTRFLIGHCITVVGKVIWTHYINIDGDANFNVKLDDKYNSLLTAANNSPKFNGAIHVEVVCQGPNKSIDPIKVNQCKNPKYDGPKFPLPPVGTRVQVTGRYLLDINEGGHAEIHPAYSIIFNPKSSAPPPSSSPPPPPTPTPAPLPTDRPPIADAGHSRPDQSVNEGSLVTLDGSASHDPDGGSLTFAWTQLSGPPVQLSTPSEPTTTFTAPSNLQADTELVFKLTVTDTGGLSDSDTASILVRHTAVIPPPPPPPTPPP